MIPCSGSEIHRWNALDDLDDDISDRVNDDLIPYDSDEFEYDDPDLLVMGSFSSSDSTVEDSEQYKNSSNEYSHIDEDGLILALDDSTNRRARNRDVMDPTNKSRDIVTVRVKKSLKYGNKENATKRTLGMTEVNKRDIIRPIPSDSLQIIRPEINTIYSDSTMNSLSPTGDDNEALTTSQQSNIITVRVKKSAKYGNKHDSVTRQRDIVQHVPSNEIVVRPKINTIHSDGTISSASPANNERYGNTVDTKPRVATIYSDGSIGYKDENNAIVDKPVQRIATINNDGTITYRLGNEIGDNEAGMILNKPSSTVATIHGDGFITYSSTSTSSEMDSKNSTTSRTALIQRKVSFDNIVTDSEDQVDEKPGSDDDDMDDDICDNIDDSRYTRSLHSMPVLEEVTEEESPLHMDSTDDRQASSAPKEVKVEPSWLELQKSPSATRTMTPRRTNDKENGEEFGTSDDFTSDWIGLKGFGSHKKKMKIGTKYQSMDGIKVRSNSGRAVSKMNLRDSRSPQNNVILQVETCSTGSHSDTDKFLNDVEAAESSIVRKGLCCRKKSSSNGYLNFASGNGNRPRKKSKQTSCFGRRELLAAIIVILIGITVGITTYFVLDKFYVEGEEDRKKERTEEWTLTEEAPMVVAIKDDEPDSEASKTSNDFETDEVDSGDVSEVDSEDNSTEMDSKDEVTSDVPGLPITESEPKDDSNEIVSAEEDKSENTTSVAFPPVVAEADPEDKHDISLVPSDAPINVDSFQTESPTASPTIVEIIQINDELISVVQDTAGINEVIRKARRQIELLIFDDDDLIGKFLRLVFHDCVGGCDGCVDLTNPENKGLDKPIDALQPVVEQFEPQGLTRTDIWMMASMVASELALPFENSDMLFPVHWIGRQTCESRFADSTDSLTGHCGLDYGGNPTTCSPTRGPHVDQPHGTMGTMSILEFFENEFGFDPQQVTAIMGAHSVGKMARENVGFMGAWDLSISSLDSGYWVKLVGNPPDFFLETVDNSDLPNIPNRHQWRGIVKDMEATTVAMLNVDVALVRNVEDMDAEGDVGCAGPGVLLKDCPSNTPFLPFATQYNADHKKFLIDFRDVLTLMIDHGNKKPTRTTVCPDGRICVFENVNVNGFALEGLTPAPTSSPTRHDQPMVSVDRVCYENVGDTIVVEYDNVSGTDITVQIFSAATVYSFEGRTIVEPSEVNSPLKSSLSCGMPSCHTWTSQGGLQISTENLVGGGSDYVVLLSARASLDDSTNDLQFLAQDSFRLEGCNSRV